MRKKVMLVEDERATRDSVSFLLLANGYNVITGTNGLEALEMLRECEDMCKDINLIILDIRMPVMSGTEFLQHATEFNKLPPVVVMSGCLDDYDLNKLGSVQPTAILPKPFKESMFLQTIDNVINK